MRKEQIPPPGSEEARKIGCRCPIVDNNYGAGIGRNEIGKQMYIISGNCPVHDLIEIIKEIGEEIRGE